LARRDPRRRPKAPFKRDPLRREAVGVRAWNSPKHVGPIRVRTTPDEIVLEAQKGYMEAALLRASGTDGFRQISW